MKTNLLILLAVAALTGCSQSELAETTDNGAVEIRLASEFYSVEGVATRGPITGTLPASLATKVLMSGTTGVYDPSKDTKNYFYDGTMTFTGTGQASFSPDKQYYPSNGDAIYLCGLYPSTGWTVNTGTGATADYTFDGKTDVMAAAEVSATKTNGQSGGTAPKLTFTHLLTKLTIKVKAEVPSGMDISAIQAKWGDITGIALTNNTKNQVSVTLAAGSAAAALAFTETVAPDFYKVTSGTTYTDDVFGSTAVPAFETAIAYSLVAPFTYSGTTAEVSLTVTTASGSSFPITVQLPKNGDEVDTQGRNCEISLTFKLTEVQATAAITDWLPGGTVEGTLE